MATLTILDTRTPQERIHQQKVEREKEKQAKRFPVKDKPKSNMVDPLNPYLDLECDYAQKYCDIPLTGPTAGLSDGKIMKAIEKLGMSLDVRLSDVATSLGLTFPAMMNRIYGSVVLSEFLEVCLKTRAYLVQEQRDKVIQDALVKAKEEALGSAEFNVLKLYAMYLDRDLARLNPTQFGKASASSKPKLPNSAIAKTIEDRQAEVLISTTLAADVMVADEVADAEQRDRDEFNGK